MNLISRRSVTSLMCMAAAAGGARAANEITVVITGSGGGRPVTVQFDAGEAINAANGLPTIETTDTRVNIYSTGSLAAIGRVTFAAASGSRSDLQVFIGTGTFPSNQNPLTAKGTDWGGIAGAWHDDRCTHRSS